MNIPELIALEKYSAPAMPTEHFFRGAWQRLGRRISSNDSPALPASDLERASLAVIDDLAEAPDCGPLLQTLDDQLGAWSRGANGQSRLCTIVVPPCDTTGTLASWARTRGHGLLPEVDRFDLVGQPAGCSQPDLAGEGLLVIPRLEHWLLRKRDGLQVVRALLSQLAGGQRRCLVGCSSGAWRFLVKSAGADLALPPPLTFEPFDAKRLRDWFSKLAHDGDGAPATFRLADDGSDVLACDDDGEPSNAHLRQLAARSGGIPWVAWHLWRASLKVKAGEAPLSAEAAQATTRDARTVWVVDVDVDDVELPETHEDRSLQVLQALLIHGDLTSAEIDAVLPTTGEPDVLAALVRTGHLRRDEASGRYHIRPTAYPAVRRSLQSAGFPLGAM